MRLQKFLYTRVYSPVLKQYLKFDTFATIGGLKIKVLSGVFHPKLFFSTSYLFEYINTLELKDCNFLEIGSGSGVLSLLACKKGAKVTATDIDKKAVENTILNFAHHCSDLYQANIIESDLFKNLPLQKFERILINPPYFFKDVQAEWQNAWYCGANGEYFNNLFAGLPDYIHPQTEINMILADNCDIEKIKGIAKEHNFYFYLIQQRKIKWETNYIFKIWHQS